MVQLNNIVISHPRPASYHFFMSRSISILLLALFVDVHASEHILRLEGSSVAPDPPANAVLISIPVNSSVVLKCEKTAGLPKSQWLHNGNDLDLEVVRLLDDEHASLIIDVYSTKYHDGVYECYAVS
ncbi:unnamed protein product [Strongylus vulgaris]|uniref:Ig-like domain-containing protein n=1 Tax=Strongylus vulgaris TaxID=40348 RepID=A0A3P7JVM3_STRVU|nr:unnamed protein product [Strongylus vulgaris]